VKLTPVTDDVSQLVLPPRAFFNAYLVGDVLVDAGLRMHAGGIIRALGVRPVATHVITHAHGDHVGGSKRVCDTSGVPAWCGAGDAAAVGAGKPVAASRVQALFRWKPCRSHVSCARATSSARGLWCSTSLAIRPATSRCGGSATARLCVAICS